MLIKLLCICLFQPDLLFVKIPLKEAQGGFRYIIIGVHYLGGSY